MARFSTLTLRLPRRIAGGCRRLALGLACAAAPLSAPAATREPPEDARIGRGEPVEQRFLRGGVSVVTTPRGQSCVASARLDIAASTYLGENDEVLPFDRIVRSPAASIQAILGQAILGQATLGEAPLAGDQGRPDSSAHPLVRGKAVDLGAVAPAFRVQLKFSPRPGTLVTLLLGPEAAPRRIEVAPVLEGSTDSLLIEGAAAAALQDAFDAGEAAHLRSTSRDTGHLVTDALPAPDLAALADCARDLVADAEVGALASQVSLRLEAIPSPETLAAPEELQACRMTPAGRPLHVGRLLSTTGFFAQTDTVLVAFDEEGRVERAYVPGILNADMTGGPEGTMQVSQAADGNVPDATNAVTGCIGAHEVAACATPEGANRVRIAACDPLPGVVDPSRATTSVGGEAEPVVASALIPSLGARASFPSVVLSLASRGGDGSVKSGSSEGGSGGNPGGEPNEDITSSGGGGEPGPKPTPLPDPSPELPPLPVPLPGAGLLILMAIGGLGLLHQRRRG